MPSQNQKHICRKLCTRLFPPGKYPSDVAPTPAAAPGKNGCKEAVWPVGGVPRCVSVSTTDKNRRVSEQFVRSSSPHRRVSCACNLNSSRPRPTHAKLCRRHSSPGIIGAYLDIEPFVDHENVISCMISPSPQPPRSSHSNRRAISSLT